MVYLTRNISDRSFYCLPYLKSLYFLLVAKMI